MAGINEHKRVSVSQTVVLNYENVAEPKQFFLHSPFIPDEVHVQALVGYVSDGDQQLAPLNAAAGYTSADVFLVNLSFMNPGSYVVAAANNTCNPVFHFMNSNQRNFQDGVVANTYNSKDTSPMTRGQIILCFTFVKQ